MQVTSLLFLRSAPVLGRSNVTTPSRFVKQNTSASSDIAASGDGRTPVEAVRLFLFTHHASRITL
jgi:hypothetical protein